MIPFATRMRRVYIRFQMEYVAFLVVEKLEKFALSTIDGFGILFVL